MTDSKSGLKSLSLRRQGASSNLFCQQDLEKECKKEKLYKAYEDASIAHKPNIDINNIDLESCVTASVYAKTVEIIERLVVDMPRFDSKKVIQKR